MKVPKSIKNVLKKSSKTVKNTSKVADEIKDYADSIDDVLKNSTKKAEDSLENLKKATKEFESTKTFSRTNEPNVSSSPKTNNHKSTKPKSSVDEKYERLNKLGEEYLGKERTSETMEEWSKKAREIEAEYEPKVKPKSEAKKADTEPKQTKGQTIQDEVVAEAHTKSNKKKEAPRSEKQNTNNREVLEPSEVITDKENYNPNITLENKVRGKLESENAQKVKSGTKKVKDGANKVKDTLFDIKEDKEKFLGFDMKLKKKFVVPAALAVGGGTLMYKGLETKERSELGTIEAGLSVGTVNASFSPTHKKMLDYAQSPEGSDEFKDKVLGRASGVSVSGADAEIVFALHKLRNGG